MPNILKVSTPATGYENNSVKNNPTASEGLQIRNPVDPSKVPRGDNRADAGQDQGTQLGFRYESNFGTFLQTLKNAPELARSFSELLFAGMNGVLEGGISQEFAADITELFQMMQMGEGEMLSFLKNQSNAAIKFKGSFFDLLRQVMGETSSVDLKTELLNFLKRYNDMSSSKHLMDSMMINLRDIKAHMFRSGQEQLEELMKQLDLEAPYGETEGNALVLKEQILPFLSQYISRSHDMGKIRDLISLLAFQISRYENGNMEEVVQSFRKLLGYQGFKKHFGEVNEETFRNILQSMDFEKDAGKSQWASRFLEVLNQGIRGEAGMENRQIFQNMVYSMLLNESVYMPLLHMMMPVDFQGRMMFAQMWVDPDAEEGQSQDSSQQMTKLFLKFDIKELGNFDLILLYGKDQVDMQLYYPEQLSEMEAQIRRGLGEILISHNMSVQSMVLEKSVRPISVSEVFPKIYERKNTVNVSV